MEGQMEEELWKELPEELQLKAANHLLPLRSQCRLRAVSRAWKTPRLRREALRGLYFRRDNSIEKSYFLHDRITSKSHFLTTGSVKLQAFNCVNGLLGAVYSKRTFPNPVTIKLFDIFSRRWTRLPRSPKAPKRGCIFAGMSKIRSGGSVPRIGIKNLDDYLFLTAMANRRESTSVLFQAFSAGEWSSSSVELPPGHSFMYSDIGMLYRCGVLRGSEFFFLTKHGTEEASLCCVDLLGQHKHRCRVLCALDKAFVSDWYLESMQHPKLAVCSGKILLVYTHRVTGKSTFGVQVLDEQKLRWRFVSSLPLELKVDNGEAFRPNWIACGGDEVIVHSLGNAVVYVFNFVTGAWSDTGTGVLHPISYQE